MQNAESLSRDQIQEFLRSCEPIEFSSGGREERYEWVERMLGAQRYRHLGKSERGLVRAYLRKVTGLSEAQTTRLIRAFLDHGAVRAQRYQRHRFAVKYTAEDMALLAEVDRAHGRLSGPATRRILQRAYEQFREKQYERLAKISVAHLYNLRASARYRNQAAVFEPTRSTAAAIGERRKPDPQGRPGYVRVDTVHQGDSAGNKGVYHINAVDAVTQWQVVGCAEKISESYLVPVLAGVLAQFPFPIRGFHADNGSEYINHRVAGMLRKLHAEFTKSRACRSQDNALVEGKNGAVIRKLIGYGHIAGAHAAALQNFYVEHLNPYLNFHRPCGFATVSLDERGKRQRKYKLEDYRTPFEKLQSLPQAESFLKPGLSLRELEKRSLAISDTECARRMSAAKTKLLGQCRTPSLPNLR
jgi:transposase InsO family protein